MRAESLTFGQSFINRRTDSTTSTTSGQRRELRLERRIDISVPQVDKRLL